jgi:acyl carrier protein
MLDDRLIEIVRDVLGDDELELTEDTVASDVPGWDSLAHINVMTDVETEYAVTFTTAQLGQFRNLGELQEFLRSRAA